MIGLPVKKVAIQNCKLVRLLKRCVLKRLILVIIFRRWLEIWTPLILFVLFQTFAASPLSQKIVLLLIKSVKTTEIPEAAYIMATKRPGDEANGNGHSTGNGDAPDAKKTKDVSY